MKNIVETIYRGEYDALAGPYDEETGRIHEKMEIIIKQLKQKIPPELHALLTEYENLSEKHVDIACATEFVAGYRLGAQLLIVALSN